MPDSISQDLPFFQGNTKIYRSRSGHLERCFMVPLMLYNQAVNMVNCKSEGNVLGVEKEPKGDAHFCK